MKNGLLIINEFLKTESFTRLYEALSKSASLYEVKLTLCTNADFVVRTDQNIAYSKLLDERPDFILFWDKDLCLATALEAMGYRLFNSKSAIEACDDKALSCSLLSGVVDMPITIAAPMTFALVSYGERLDFIKRTADILKYPFVIKECSGSFGQQVHLAHSFTEASDIILPLSGKKLIFQEYIHESIGNDLRIYMVGGQCIAAMKRHNDSDFRANIALGGSSERYTPNDEQIELAQKVCATLNLDFAGIDILFGQNEKPIFCEANSNAHFAGIESCCNVSVSDAIIRHILESIYHD